MRSFFTLLLPLLGLTGLLEAKSSSGDSVLVVLEPNLPKDDFSIFFKDLEEQGYDLTFRSTRDVTPAIFADGIPSFSHVILFTPSTKTYTPDITPQSLVSLLSSDSNLLIALSPKQTPLTSLASEFSLILPPPGTPLISHFPGRSEPATMIPITPPKSHAFLSSNLSPLWFSGVPHAFGSNPYIVPILNAPSESFAADSTGDSDADALVDAAEKAGEGLWAGSQLGVVSGFQTKDSARVAWVGGVEMFTDQYFKKEVSKGVKSGNRQFARDLTAWTFRESLVLRIDSTTHHKVNETSPPESYTTNDEVVFSANLSKYNPKTATWEPCACRKDLQLEFTMLDPHIRTALPAVPGSPGTYSVAFRVPDRHGVFKFIIDYKRKGWTYLYSSTTVPVVPPRHDGYPRFLSAAWPYYVGAISTSVGFLLFSALWLAGDARVGKTSKTE